MTFETGNYVFGFLLLFYLTFLFFFRTTYVKETLTNERYETN